MLPIQIPKSKSPLREGTYWRRHGETLSWELVEIEGDRVVLVGPGCCKGRMVVSGAELGQRFVRA